MDNNSLKLTTNLLPGFVILVYIINLFFFKSRACTFLSTLEILMALAQKVLF